MKKLLFIILTVCLALSFTACKKNEAKKPELPTIGIAKLISHNSLNDAEKGILDELKELNIHANIDLQNANGDLNISSAIASKFKSDNVDVAVGIATPMTVTLANQLPNTPIVFTAVTDPVKAGIASSITQGNKNITGVIDAIPIKEQLIEFKKIYDFKKLGIIYTTSETNSVSMAETTKQVCDELGVELIVQTIATPAEVKQAAESLVSRVDAFYCFTDNSIATAMSALTDTAKQNKIPVFGGDITPTLNGGVVYALGFSYYEMGRMTGRLIAEVLQGKKAEELPIQSLNDPKFYNKLLDLDTAKLLGITFNDELINSAQYLIKDGKLITK
ncbi:ABC transporter substrate-binding protein [Mucispirillum schaedleri]|uniref:ABC transporter substrate-binding protein n=1 Tax=Mucispirillum schaedleri TaxID=248039 RepID=UPI001F56EC0B|nr:ABC transporter substrate-binding protein [Mucispirillum schaedleri]